MTISKTWPGGSSNVTPQIFSIPEAGELNWASLTDFLVALADGSQTTTFQKFAIREAVTSPVTVSTNDCIVSTNLTIAGAVAVALPAGDNKQIFYISDGKGDAVTNNITITPDGSETIAGQSSLVLNTNNQSVLLAFNSTNTNWVVVFNSIPNPTGGNIGGFTGDRAIISTAGGVLTTSATTSAEIAFVNGVTSSIQTQLNGKQPLDSDLTALAGVNTFGLLVRTGVGTATTRQVAAGSSKISVANGDGVSGDPAIDVVEANVSLNNLGGSLDLTTQVSGALPITNGGTGQITQTAAFDALSPTTTKGDIIVNNGTNNIRLAAGTNGNAIIYNSATASGLDEAVVVTNPMDSDGDMIYGGASGVATKLDAGTANQVLQSNGAAAPSWVSSVTLVDGTFSGTVQSDVLEADTITDEAGTGAPDFSNGLTLSTNSDILSVYDVESSSATATAATGGSFTGTPTIEYNLIRIGNAVIYTIRLSGTYTPSGGLSGLQISLPVGFRPSASRYNLNRVSGSTASFQVVFTTTVIQIFNYTLSTGSLSQFATNADTNYMGGAYVL